MKRIALVVLVVLATGAGAVAAQDTGTATATETQTATPDPGADTAVIQIQGGVLEVMQFGYDSEEQVMRITVRTPIPRTVSLSDVYGSIEAGGGAAIVPTKRTAVGGGRSVLTMRAVPYRGTVVVSLGTSNGAVSLTDSTGQALLGGSPTWQDVRLGTALGAAAALLAVVFVAYRRELGRSGDVERGPL